MVGVSTTNAVVIFNVSLVALILLLGGLYTSRIVNVHAVVLAMLALGLLAGVNVLVSGVFDVSKIDSPKCKNTKEKDS